MSYSLKKVQSGPSREGKSFYAQLYCEDKKICDLEDHGDGGMSRIRYDSPALEKKHTKPLRDWLIARNYWLAKMPVSKIDEERIFQALEEIYDYNKASKKGILFIEKFFEDRFDQREAIIKGQSLDDKGLMTELVKKYPKGFVWVISEGKFVPVKEVLKNLK